jgi:hypothetical protein
MRSHITFYKFCILVLRLIVGKLSNPHSLRARASQAADDRKGVDYIVVGKCNC